MDFKNPSDLEKSEQYSSITVNRNATSSNTNKYTVNVFKREEIIEKNLLCPP